MIQLQNVVKEYTLESEKIRALDNISFSVAPGERVGVLGKNGSGKSTLIRLVGRVELPTKGVIRRQMSVSWPLGFRSGFRPNLTAYENIRFIADVYDRPLAEVVSYVEDFSELGKRLGDPLNTYSNGMRAKLSFGLSLAIEFECYLIDEVVAVGDRRFRRKCREELLEKRAGKALLMVSHHANVIDQFCETAVLLEKGRHVDTIAIGQNPNWRKQAASVI